MVFYFVWHKVIQSLCRSFLRFQLLVSIVLIISFLLLLFSSLFDCCVNHHHVIVKSNAILLLLCFFLLLWNVLSLIFRLFSLFIQCCKVRSIVLVLLVFIFKVRCLVLYNRTYRPYLPVLLNQALVEIRALAAHHA